MNIEKKQIYTHTKAFSFVFTFLSCLSFSCQFPVSFLSLPSMFLLFPSIISSFYVHIIEFPSLTFVLSCPSDVPLVSLSVRLIFLLIFLSCPFHFTLLSLQFPSLFPSSHSIFLVCPVIFQNHIEFPCIFVSNYVHGPWFFS